VAQSVSQPELPVVYVFSLGRIVTIIRRMY